MPLFKVSLESQVAVSAIVVSNAATDQEAVAEVRFLQSRARVNWSRGGTLIGAVNSPYEVWVHPRVGGGWEVSLSANILVSVVMSIIAEDAEAVQEIVSTRQASGLIQWKYRDIPIGEYREPIPTYWSNLQSDVPTVTTLSLDATSVYPGQSVTMSIVVTGAETPVGNVAIKDVTPGGVGTIVLAPLEPDPVTAGVSYASAVVVLPAAEYEIVAAYEGQDGYQASESAQQNLSVSKVETTVNINPPSPPVYTGQDLAVQVYVSNTVDVSAPPATGTVTIFENGVILSSTQLDGSASATFNLGSRPQGTYVYTVQYDGDDIHAASSADSPDVVVELAVPRVTLTVLDNGFEIFEGVYSQNITLRATVESLVPFAPYTPTGNVTFNFGSGTVTVPINTVSSGVARADVSLDDLVPNLYMLYFEYHGDSNFGTATSDQKPFGIQKATTFLTAFGPTGPTRIGEPALFQSGVGVLPPATRGPFEEYGTSAQIVFGDQGFAFVNLDNDGIAYRTHAFDQVGGWNTSVAFFETPLFKEAQAFLFHTTIAADLTGDISFNPDPVPYNAQVTITAHLIGAAPGVADANGGLANFSVFDPYFYGELYLGSALAVNGYAEITATNPALISATYTVTCQYTGDGNVNAGSITANVFAFGFF